jgi:ABC-type dipeptide/oligopeptide/nickel transport system permease component
MPYCCRCRRFISTSFEEFVRQNAWCDTCHDVVSTSLCQIPVWVFMVVVVLAIHVQIVSWF